MRFGWAGKVAVGAAVPVIVGLGAFLFIARDLAGVAQRDDPLTRARSAAE